MTQPLNFTSIAPAPVGCLLDCAKTGDAANNLKLARAIDVELDGRGSEQHVKIKVGTLRVLVESIQSLDKLSASLEAQLGERKERVESLEGIVKDVVSQRDAWVIWARGYTDAPAGIHNTEQLIDMVKAKVKGSQHTFQGTLKVTKLKEDVLLTSRGWCKMQDGNVTIENAVVASGSIPASKVTFSDEMKAAIREVIRDEIADLNKAVVDILSKMRK